MAVSMTDTEQVTLTAVESDADNQSVTITDTLIWASDDNGAVVTLAPSADTLSCVVTAVAPGTANVTVTDSSANLVSAPEAVTVTAGAATTISIEAGSPGAIPSA